MSVFARPVFVLLFGSGSSPIIELPVEVVAGTCRSTVSMREHVLALRRRGRCRQPIWVADVFDAYVDVRAIGTGCERGAGT